MAKRPKVHKLSWNYTTKEEKQIIHQALGFKTTKGIIKKGWKKLGTGAFKQTYRKGNVVVKFPNTKYSMGHIKNEAQTYFKIPVEIRHHFARIFGYTDYVSVQRYVPTKPYQKFTKKELTNWKRLWHSFWKPKKKYPWAKDMSPGHNVTADEKGKPIIFDFGQI